MEKDLMKSLSIVRRDAQKQAEYHAAKVGGKPLGGSWDQEKHDKYHQQHADEARQVANWLLIRQMQINPD